MQSCRKWFLFSLQISYWSPFLFPVVIFWFNFATLWCMKIINDENFPHNHLILKNYESTFCLKHHCAPGIIPDWKTASCNEVMFIFTEPFWNVFPSLILYNMFSMPLGLTLIISGSVTLQPNHADAFLKSFFSLAASSSTFVLCLALCFFIPFVSLYLWSLYNLFHSFLCSLFLVCLLNLLLCFSAMGPWHHEQDEIQTRVSWGHLGKKFAAMLETHDFVLYLVHNKYYK